MNIIKNRYLYFMISLLIIIPGLIFMGLTWSQTRQGPLTLGIDFKGGSLLEVQFAGARPDPADITAIYSQFSTTKQPIANPVVQPLGESSYAIRSAQMDDPTKTKIVEAMQQKSGVAVTIQNFTSVSPSVGAEVTRAAGIAILMAAIAILLYIWFAFRGVERSFRYGTAAVIAMLRDMLVGMGVEAILGYFLH